MSTESTTTSTVIPVAPVIEAIAPTTTTVALTTAPALVTISPPVLSGVPVASVGVVVPSPKASPKKPQGVLMENVYDLHSRLSLPRIDKIVADVCDKYRRKNSVKKALGFGLVRIIYHGSVATDLAAVVMNSETFTALVEAGYGNGGVNARDMRIEPFYLKSSAVPGEGQNESLFVPVPKTINESDLAVSEAIEAKLIHLAKWNVIPAGSWRVNVMLQDRVRGTVGSGVFVTFTKDVPIEKAATARILMNDTNWPAALFGSEGDAVPTFRCFWANDRPKKEFKKDEASVRTQGKQGPRTTVAKKEVVSEEDKEKNAMLRMAKEAKPVKKAPTIPVAPQPVLSTTD